MRLLKALLKFFKKYQLESAAIAFAEAGEIEIAREFLKEAKGEKVPEILIKRKEIDVKELQPEVVRKH